MIYRYRVRNLSADANKQTTTKHKIIVYSGLAVLVAAVLIRLIFF